MQPLKRLMMLFLLALLPAVAVAGNVPVGYVSYDYIGGGLAEFDVINQTGPNSSPYPDETWPVTTSVNLSSLSLTVYLANGTEMTYGSGYFTLEPDGLSWEGPTVPQGEQITMATLTGAFNPVVWNLNNGTQVTVIPTFTATISDPNNLQNGDFAVIYGMTTGATVPEPSSFVLLTTGAVGLLGIRHRKFGRSLRRWLGNRTTIALFVCCLMLMPLVHEASASTVVRLNQWTSPSQGYAGTGQVNVAGSGFPTGTIFAGNITISIWSSGCQVGEPVATATGLLFKRIIGSAGSVQFLIPNSIATEGVYLVSVSDTTSGQQFTSSNCSMVRVLIHSVIGSCVPGASMGVLAQAPNVTAYVPNGAWDFGTTGIKVIPVEGGGSSTTIATPNVPNSCSSNSTTGQTVCVANNTDVYLITGSSLNNLLTDGATGSLNYSGGSCVSCGVAVDQLNNRAVITMGISGSPSGGGFQALDLATLTFAAPLSTYFHPSEDIQLDPGRNFLLSPNESNDYDLLDTSANPWKEYVNMVGNLPGEFDSAAEDCTTGIALSTEEGSTSLYITDLTQVNFINGTPYGTWSAPEQSVVFPEFGHMGAGTDGIAVAPGSHLAIVTGEFGGNEIAVVTLPSTSGSGTPQFGDYVAAYLPNTPDGLSFSLGFDPHTVTAYVSPNNGGVYGLAADWETGVPTYVAVIDMQGLLSAPRCHNNCLLGPHEVDPTYDLLTHGIVSYVH